MKRPTSRGRSVRRVLVVNAATVLASLLAEVYLVRVGASLAVFARPGAPLVAIASLAGVVLVLRIYVLAVVPARLAFVLSQRAIAHVQPSGAASSVRPPTGAAGRGPA